MTGTTTGTTTERRRLRPTAFSVRTRITVVITLLASLALAGAGLLVYVLEAARVEQQTTDQIDQEIDEFKLLEGGDDPETGEPFTTAIELLYLYLERNVPDDDEILVAYPPEGEARSLAPGDSGRALLLDPAYLQAVEDLRETGGTRVFDDLPPYGEVWVTVQPVNQANLEGGGALVVVNLLDDERSEIRDTMQTYSIVGVLSLGLIVLLASSQSGRLLAPLRTLRETADEISESDLSRRIPERGNDDITALTRTVNTMLDRLEGGFTAQRRFLDDAGHELKTPLTVLRGHLELIDAADPADVEETKELLLEEIDRMARLVGDLILLAKADRPDFVTPRDLAVDPLVAGVLARARALGDRRWSHDGAPDATVLGDEQRLTQALLQLADNAVKHTGAGDEVAIGAATDGAGEVRLWVRDTGDGVPEADRERIFQRFGRSVVRDGDEGFGLGLSIVGAIVDAHDGTVHVEDAEGGGARFVITLPQHLHRTAAEDDEQPTLEIPRTPGVSAREKEQPWPAS